VALVVSRLISNAEPNVAKVDIWDKDWDIAGRNLAAPQWLLWVR